MAASLIFILWLFFPCAFSVKGFALAQDGKVNTFLKIVLVTSPNSNMSDISKKLFYFLGEGSKLQGIN